MNPLLYSNFLLFVSLICSPPEIIALSARGLWRWVVRTGGRRDL